MPSQKTLDRFEEERAALRVPTGHVWPFETVDEPLPAKEWHPTIGQTTAASSEEPPDFNRVYERAAEAMRRSVQPISDSDRLAYERTVELQNYTTLRTILDAAFAHAATGKGKERHARDLPFDDQPIMQTTRLVGPGFPLGQAIKKAGEAAGMIERGELDAAEGECLGAINYLAGAVAWMREQGKMREAA